MTSKPSFVRKEVEPDDILSAAKTIPSNNANTCKWFQNEWIYPEKYLQWAKQDLKTNGDYGLSNALCYAKRTTCRIIDALIFGNHLRPFIKKNYPKKIEVLSKIGMSIPHIVHELIIDPRNQLEHDYKIPNQQEARHAVQLAELFLNATKQESDRPSIVALAWNVQCSQSASRKDGKVSEIVEFKGFSREPMLFIDIFMEPAEVKIVHPQDEKVYFAHLESFTGNESIKLAKKLREHYAQPSHGSSNSGRFFYEEIKRQGGF